MKKAFYLLLALLYLAHNDFWFWKDATLVFGLPVGLFYHIVYCFVCAGFFYALTTWAWPQHLDNEGENGKL